MAAKLSKPNNAEHEWIANNLALTRRFVSELTSDQDDVTPSTLDTAFGIWLGQHDAESEDPNPVINAFGIAFGQYLVDQLQLRWVVASGENGTEIAVHGQPGDILVYPANLVAKRYVACEAGFFVPLFDGIRKNVEMVRTGVRARRWWKFW